MAAIEANSDTKLLQNPTAPHGRRQYAGQLALAHHQVIGGFDRQWRAGPNTPWSQLSGKSSSHAPGEVLSSRR